MACLHHVHPILTTHTHTHTHTHTLSLSLFSRQVPERRTNHHSQTGLRRIHGDKAGRVQQGCRGGCGGACGGGARAVVRDLEMPSTRVAAVLSHPSSVALHVVPAYCSTRSTRIRAFCGCPTFHALSLSHSLSPFIRSRESVMTAPPFNHMCIGLWPSTTGGYCLRKGLSSNRNYEEMGWRQQNEWRFAAKRVVGERRNVVRASLGGSCEGVCVLCVFVCVCIFGA